MESEDIMKLIEREQYLDRMKALDQYLVKCLLFLGI